MTTFERGLVIHRSSRTPFSFIENGHFFYKESDGSILLSERFVYWRTCQRQLVFVRPLSCFDLEKESFQNELGALDQFFSDKNLELFLLKMACGLLSKVKGETEVMGQFKKFISILHKQDSWLKYAFNFEKLLAEVKRCRSGFLTDLGSQSYGSVVRKWIPEGAEVSLVGAGLLAKDIEPWLKNRNVTVFSRSPAKAKTISSVKDLNLLQRAEFLVIAAPLENHSIQSLIAKSHCRHMIDLRALTQEQEAEVKSFCSQRNLQIFTLTDLFSLIDSDRPEILKKVQMAEEALKKFVESLDAHLMIRPLGWEDVCA